MLQGIMPQRPSPKQPFSAQELVFVTWRSIVIAGDLQEPPEAGSPMDCSLNLFLLSFQKYISSPPFLNTCGLLQSRGQVCQKLQRSGRVSTSINLVLIWSVLLTLPSEPRIKRLRPQVQQFSQGALFLNLHIWNKSTNYLPAPKLQEYQNLYVMKSTQGN